MISHFTSYTQIRNLQKILKFETEIQKIVTEFFKNPTSLIHHLVFDLINSIVDIDSTHVL